MKLLAKVGSLALIATVAGGVVVGCSGTETKSPGTAKEGRANTVGLALQPVAGVTINTVHAIVTKTGVTTPVLELDVPTPGTAATFNFGLPIPVGSGYTLSLSGVSVESATITCAGSVGPFNVLPNQTAQLTTSMVCSDVSKGSLNDKVIVTNDACPHLSVDYVFASPNAANVGSAIAVAGKATDSDNKPITFAWTVATPTVGSFASATSASTSFNCALGGADVPVTLTANNGECSKSLSTVVTCLNVLCGNGVKDPSEQCDPSSPAPGNVNCKPDCTLAVCGNKILETPFEACDPNPADLNNCTSTCTIRPIACGDGYLTGNEPCDGTLFPPNTPAGATCKSDCSGLNDIILCGDGKVQGTEVCDPKLTVNNCGRDCNPITNATCLACDNTSECVDFVDCFQITGNIPATSPGGGGGTPKAQACNEVLDCIRDSGCAAGGNALIKCYCGTASSTACQTGGANGVCKTELEKGLETVTFNEILGRLKSPQYGGGIAGARIDCEQAACKVPCGLN